MFILLTIVATTFAYNNAEFTATVKQQINEGYEWSKIDCRKADPNLPAITFRTNGNNIVCSKLVK
jgi:hypothetical protein